MPNPNPPTMHQLQGLRRKTRGMIQQIREILRLREEIGNCAAVVFYARKTYCVSIALPSLLQPGPAMALLPPDTGVIDI